MEITRDRGTATEGRSELIELHLIDTNAREEKALCGADASVHDLTTVQHYLERREHDLSLPTVCNRCKASVIHFAKMCSAELADGGMTDKAKTYPSTRFRGRPPLACEATGLDDGLSSICVRLLRLSARVR